MTRRRDARGYNPGEAPTAQMILLHLTSELDWHRERLDCEGRTVERLEGEVEDARRAAVEEDPGEPF